MSGRITERMKSSVEIPKALYDRMRRQISDGSFRIRNCAGHTGKDELTLEQWREILFASGGYCQGCGKYLGLENLEIEHIKRLSDGGDHAAHNVTAVCRSCNLKTRRYKKRGKQRKITTEELYALAAASIRQEAQTPS